MYANCTENVHNTSQKIGTSKDTSVEEPEEV